MANRCIYLIPPTIPFYFISPPPPFFSPLTPYLQGLPSRRQKHGAHGGLHLFKEGGKEAGRERALNVCIDACDCRIELSPSSLPPSLPQNPPFGCPWMRAACALGRGKGWRAPAPVIVIVVMNVSLLFCLYPFLPPLLHRGSMCAIETLSSLPPYL